MAAFILTVSPFRSFQIIPAQSFFTPSPISTQPTFHQSFPKHPLPTMISTDSDQSADSANDHPDHSSKPDPDQLAAKSFHSSLRFTDKGGAHLSHLGTDTKVIKAGHRPQEWSTDPLGRSVVNPPVYHASTVTFPNLETLRFAAKDWPYTGMWYGRHGNPTTWALEEAFATIEGADNACVVSSGVAAVNAAILAFIKAGDHVLVTDSVYDPSRSFCNGFLKRFNVDTDYFSPLADINDLEALVRPGKTKVILVENPGSLTFEIMDMPKITQWAHSHDIKVVIDNTWGPLIYQPFKFGCDVSVNAATKYIGGHSDIIMGIIACTRETYRTVKNSVKELGCPPGSDDCYLALRGIRTLAVRMKAHQENALKVASYLESQRVDVVARVMHPALPSHPQHRLWKRDFTGAAGLFGFQLKAGFSQKQVEDFVHALKLFSIGFSYGGFESLVLITNINAVRSVNPWKYGDGYGQTLRLQIGLEDPDDLIRDLEQAFKKLTAA